MYRLIIVEDNDVQSRRLAKLVQEKMGGSVLVEQYATAEEFYVRSPAFPPEIALLDIQLPGESGLDLARYLNGAAPGCQIIYLTSFIDYAVDVYRTQHVWFITKDRIPEMLPAALEEAKNRLDRENSRVLKLSLQDGIQLIPQYQILYMERKKRSTFIFTASQTVTCAEPLPSLLTQLDPNLFVRCHNSYIVNIRCIRYFRRSELEMTDGSIVLVSRYYHRTLRNLFGQYLRESALPPHVQGPSDE